ncbi:MAG: type III pantothenate kinase [Flavobacteriales bacterium]|nr:type III pantothenate kinase [Flavobacteriales bacterium]
MNLIIDIGNTSAKLAVFDNGEIIEKTADRLETIANKIQTIHQTYSIQGCIVSSVVEDTKTFITACQKHFPTIVLSPETSIPISNKYNTPKTLGNDRLACAVASSSKYKNQNTLSIDLGTCIKYDFIDEQNNYQGGAISPGMQMRFNSLNTFTSQLPLVRPNVLTNYIGKSTKLSILSGVQNGIEAEINGVIAQYKNQYGQLNVIITGGDHKYFEKGLKNITFADPSLVLRGLNEILEYNTKN